jgi:hypothetical protein
VLLVLLAALFYIVSSSFKSHELLLSAALLVTLLVSPYLYNYDFLLLLVPFAVLASKGSLPQKLVVLVCYLAATLSLLLLGRAGNSALILVAVALTALLYIRARTPSLTFPGQRHTI